MSLTDMKTLAERVFVNSKTAPEIAAIVARALVSAEADGMASHGLSRIPAYADQAKFGKVDGFATPRIEQPKKSAITVNAASGFAYPAINMGLDAAAEIVSETGIVGVAIGHSHHSGVAGHPVERMADRGLVALSFGNSPAGLSPWGGNRPLYGTNPIAFACPRRAAAPLVVDLSMAKVARGKVKLAADRGEGIPEGWAVDAAGQPTTDAKAAMAGAMLPMGDAKGAALTLVVEIIAALLTCSNIGFEASSFFEVEGKPPHIGQFFMVIDPAVFAGNGFLDRVEVLMTAISEQPGTRLPGQRRHALRAAAEADGVDLPDALFEDLTARAG